MAFLVRTCEDNAAGENNLFIFTVYVKSVPQKSGKRSIGQRYSVDNAVRIGYVFCKRI